jgi:aryl-alcohol dehydrogenase-like predicted oxidoreductase
VASGKARGRTLVYLHRLILAWPSHCLGPEAPRKRLKPSRAPGRKDIEHHFQRIERLIMRYKLLGKSGVRVSELCLGTLTFGNEHGFGASKVESRAIFDAFVEAGGNFIDTANVYTNGTSEEYLSDFIAGDRDRVFLGTKYSLSTLPEDPNASGNHRKNMRQALHASLKRLKTDHIDLYWVHAWDFLTPVDEVMRSLDDFVRAGKVLYVGISDTPAWVVSWANVLADLRGWTPFVALQLKYNLTSRDAERDLLPVASAMDLAVTVWGSLAFGLLSGKFGHQEKRMQVRQANNRIRHEGHEKSPSLAGLDMKALLSEGNQSIADEVVKISKEIGCSAAQVALKWVKDQGQNMIPIVGVRNVSQLIDNLACLTITLTKEQQQRLDTVSKIEMGFPHDFLAFNRFKVMLDGKKSSLIDRKGGFKGSLSGS